MPSNADVIREVTEEYGYRFEGIVNGARVYRHPHRQEPLVIRGKNTDRVGPVTYRGIKAQLNRE